MREQVPGALLVCPVPNQLEAMPSTDAVLKSVGETQRPPLTQVDFMILFKLDNIPLITTLPFQGPDGN